MRSDRAVSAILVICTVTAFIIFAAGSFFTEVTRPEAAVVFSEEEREPAVSPETDDVPEQILPTAAQPEPLTAAGGATVKATTIEGGLTIRNDTSFTPDIAALMAEPLSQTLPGEGVQILIIHTHSSEAYMPDAENSYETSDSFRTQDERYNILRVGDELAACFESYGLTVLHDRGVYDYPSYTGSYGRSGEAAQRHLTEHPEIVVVFDIHRDAIGAGDVIYKTVAEGSGEPSSQIMLLAGTGENGLAHPNWQENLKFALYLQKAVTEKYSTLMRPVALKKERYNQQLTTASLIMEVGSSGNTLPEALRAVRLFADAAAPALLQLVEGQ